MGCGAISGAIGALTATPLDVIKTRLQVQTYHSKSGEARPEAYSIRTMFRSILKQDGWIGLFKGAQVCID